MVEILLVKEFSSRRYIYNIKQHIYSFLFYSFILLILIVVVLIYSDEEPSSLASLWEGKTRITIWENGFRRFELDPRAGCGRLIVNFDNQELSRSLLAKLGNSPNIKRLAAFCKTLPYSINPQILTHLQIHRYLFNYKTH